MSCVGELLGVRGVFCGVWRGGGVNDTVPPSLYSIWVRGALTHFTRKSYRGLKEGCIIVMLNDAFYGWLLWDICVP